ncbi:MAG: M43 family zinc metalloprotease [Bacteroidota bacterium]|nr:M43 family zinc metalloprotease [Bacteroidota bacterium]
MKIYFTLLATSLSFYAHAQRCATDEYIKSNKSAFTQKLSTPVIASGGRDTLANEVIVVPIIVHVLYNNSGQNITDAQVQSQIDALNKDYRRLNEDAEKTPFPFTIVAADTRIVFCLAKVDPNGRYTPGIVRKYTKTQFWLSDDEMKFSSKGGDDAWNSKKYLNIWVCNLFGRTLGYAVFPGGPPERDGVVIQYNVFGTTGNLNAEFNKGRTSTHEIGHWLGLKHLWGDGSCGDDDIFDTPPQETNNSYCPSFPHTSLCSVNAFGDMYMNYMDFTDDACMNLFTKGQKIEMRSQFALGNSRNSILRANVCDSSLAQGGPLPIDSTENTPDIKIYPNPFTNTVVIQSQNSTDLIGKTIKLYDAAGKLFVDQKLQSQKTVISLSQFLPGIYFMKIEGLKNLKVFKLIKQPNSGR